MNTITCLLPLSHESNLRCNKLKLHDFRTSQHDQLYLSSDTTDYYDQKSQKSSLQRHRTSHGIHTVFWIELRSCKTAQVSCQSLFLCNSWSSAH
jgi:hypothetical protein